ncbi:MAG: 2-hydroxyacyl-CoA dehydratase family protein, partial [Dehalococcoidia bacterium]|nr:2-hydroxyacyl-CoA dehydratase family protein [Dehalococcoidia bacterium]
MGVREQLQEFQDILDNRYQVIKENRKPDQKAIGWMCSYVPEEIIYAAGLYPVRVWGGKNSFLADAYMHINMCSVVRSTYNEALQGNYNFLDGFVTLNTCDNIRRLYDIWVYYDRTPYHHILPLPHKVTQASIEYFRDELERFQESLERGFGVRVTSTALWQAIDLYNHGRSLLRQIDNLRKQPNPPLTGSQFLAVVLAGTILPREKYNTLLEKLLVSLPQEKAKRDDSVRLLL